MKTILDLEGATKYKRSIRLIKKEINMEPDNNYKFLKAKERVEEIKKFYGNLLSYAAIIIVVAAINYYLNEWRRPWFLWVVFGLGISIAVQGIKTFGLRPFYDKNWEERKIKEFMDEEDRKRPSKWE